MKPQRVCALYYSATGTTDRAVNTIAEALAQKLELPLERFGFTKPAERDKEYCFTERDLVVVGSPTYAGKLPNKILPDFKARLHGGGCLGSGGGALRKSQLRQQFGGSCARYWRGAASIPLPAVPLWAATPLPMLWRGPSRLG